MAWDQRSLRRIHESRKRRVARGFTLLEALVAILILSFGLLGLAGLQATTAKFKVGSWVRSAVSVQFADLADRVRANPIGAGATIGTTPPIASGYTIDADWASQQADALAIPTDCSTTVCTAAQRAQFDLLVWRTAVRRQFPQGAVIVTGGGAGGGAPVLPLNATIAWFDKQFTEVNGALSTSPTCPTNAAALAALNPAQRASCCPVALDAPAGVRCANFSFLP
jgi:type IV pilus assembly protein PilV